MSVLVNHEVEVGRWSPSAGVAGSDCASIDKWSLGDVPVAVMTAAGQSVQTLSPVGRRQASSSIRARTSASVASSKGLTFWPSSLWAAATCDATDSTNAR